MYDLQHSLLTHGKASQISDLCEVTGHMTTAPLQKQGMERKAEQLSRGAPTEPPARELEVTS